MLKISLEKFFIKSFDFFINGRDGFKYFLPEEFTEGLKILEVFYERKNDFK